VKHFGRGRRVRYFCQDESRFGLKTLLGRRITLKGIKPIMPVGWSRENFWLYRAIEPSSGEHFFYSFSHLDSICFGRFIELFGAAFSDSLNLLHLDQEACPCRNHLEMARECRANFSALCPFNTTTRLQSSMGLFNSSIAHSNSASWSRCREVIWRSLVAQSSILPFWATPHEDFDEAIAFEMNHCSRFAQLHFVHTTIASAIALNQPIAFETSQPNPAISANQLEIV
jgi:hypothetical protein